MKLLKGILELSFATLTVSMAFTACSETTNVTETTGPVMVAAFEELTKCTSKNEGDMVYVKDSAEAYLCANKEWKKMSVSSSKNSDEKDNSKEKDSSDVKDSSEAKDSSDVKGSSEAKDSSDAKDSSCIAERIEIGYKIVCGGDSVGVLLDDKSDKRCSLVNDSDGVVTMECGGKEMSFYKATCGAAPYDPAEKICDTRDNNLYRYKIIAPAGTKYKKAWMLENLNYAAENSLCYNSDGKSCSENGYGRSYNWATAVGKTLDQCGDEHKCNLGKGNVQGICPNGWHLPTKKEWKALINAVGGEKVAGKNLRSKTGWNDYEGPNGETHQGNGDDVYDFAALPAGYVLFDELTFLYVGDDANFWTASEVDEHNATIMIIMNMDDEANLFDYGMGKDVGCSIRCVQD